MLNSGCALGSADVSSCLCRAVSWLLMVNFGLNIFQQFEARTGSLAATATAAIEGTGHALASVLRVKGLLSAVYAAAAVCSAALAGAQWLAPPAAMVALGSAADGQLLGRILASTTAFAAVNLLVLKACRPRMITLSLENAGLVQQYANREMRYS